MILPARPAARLAAVHSAFPAATVDREQTVAALLRLFPEQDPTFVAQLVERSGVEQRHLALELPATLAQRNFTERNAAWRAVALDLAIRAARGALAQAGRAPHEVDVLIDVSCTGITIPALDVDLVPALGLRDDVRRVPITESGCAAGALALGLAGSFAQAQQTTLVVAVELCSLTLCRDDVTRTNLVASALFGDGAAAALVAPDLPGPRLVAVGSHLLPGTRGLMGFDIGTHGMRIVLQRELPALLTASLRPVIESFLARHERTLDDVGMHLIHPGGRRILDAYCELFGLEAEALSWSREALRRYGNLSSASILTVLELALASGARPLPGREALAVGIGPGLSIELSLWCWES